jgi:hypothetical protein
MKQLHSNVFKRVPKEEEIELLSVDATLKLWSRIIKAKRGRNGAKSTSYGDAVRDH